MENKREQIIQTLLESIKTGKYAAEDKLPPERELAAEMGVSRTPMREAIRILAKEGLVELRPARSPVVANPTLKIADIPALAEIAKSNDLSLVVDNTFTPMVVATYSGRLALGQPTRA